MFPLEQDVIHRYRSFWCGIALKHSREFWDVFGADDWWQGDLPEQRLRLPIITKAIWDEMVAWARLREVKGAYRKARSRFSEELYEQEIGDYELGSDLRIRGGGP